jgi:hypothetical protein
MIWTVDTNSTDQIGLGADQLGHQSACTEVWGGNNIDAPLGYLPRSISGIRLLFN